MERRLAAIFAADVAGYSRLIGVDEEGTLERLRAHRRELIDPKIAEHQGRIVKTTGDGVLVEFASPVKAVRCAIEMQHGMVDRNADVPREQRIEFRIGINLGDVVVEDGDIYGDGVNVAARLENIAEPCAISSTIRPRWHWRIWAKSRSRTSPSRCGCSASPRRIERRPRRQRQDRRRCRTSRRSPCCRSPI